MFVKGDKVICIDAKMEGCGPALDEGHVYTVRELVPASECSPSHYEWDRSGGRMKLEEPPHGFFYGRRFQVATKPASDWKARG